MRRAFMRTYGEVVETASRLGVRLERIAANPMLLYVPKDAGAVTRLFKDVLVRIIGRRYGRLKGSMLQSLERGRKTEIDFLNGYVVQKAQDAGVPTPVNAALARLIREIESGTRAIARQNIDDLLGEIG
jgi:2-dehydropantoate 2-reductase